ncbi:MAG: hypothetical protein OXN89_01185 [Bryobacterales bacterium]|nr:hypothetical protein [Bryobacterales bacterium]
MDIDPAQERIDGRFLGVLSGEAGRFAAADARAFLRGDAGNWEAIVVDTYSNSRTLPQHLLTAEFYGLARSRLADGGSLYVNHLISFPGLQLPQSLRHTGTPQFDPQSDPDASHGTRVEGPRPSHGRQVRPVPDLVSARVSPPRGGG